MNGVITKFEMYESKNKSGRIEKPVYSYDTQKTNPFSHKEIQFNERTLVEFSVFVFVFGEKRVIFIDNNCFSLKINVFEYSTILIY